MPNKGNKKAATKKVTTTDEYDVIRDLDGPMKEILISAKNNKLIDAKDVNKIRDKIVNDYPNANYFIRVNNGHRWFTISQKSNDWVDDFDDYYEGEVTDPSKFVNGFHKIDVTILT